MGERESHSIHQGMPSVGGYLSSQTASEALLIHQQIATSLGQSRLRLRFPHWLEKEFAQSQDEASRRAFFRNVIFVLIAMAVLGGSVLWFIPGALDKAWGILFGALLVVVAFASLFMTLAEPGGRGYQAQMALYTWLGLSLVLLMQGFISDPQLKLANQIGSLYAVIIGYTMLGLRFRAALVACWAAGGCFCVLMLLLGKSIDWHLFHRTFTGGSLLGMFLCFTAEKHARLMFMHARISELEKQRIEELNEELERVSREDSLTGLANRRFFEQVYGVEWRRAMRDNKPLAVLLLDVDFFKCYNDAYGHLRGDVCLQQVADILMEHARRPGDMAARYGGEEFVMLYPNTDKHAAEKLAEQLVNSVRSACIAHDASACADRVTVSVGVAATVPEDEHSRESLLEQADRALYQAKEYGRDRWVVAAA